MKKIKTREKVKNIKMLDKSIFVGQRTSKTALKTADHTSKAAQKTAQAIPPPPPQKPAQRQLPQQ